MLAETSRLGPVYKFLRGPRCFYWRQVEIFISYDSNHWKRFQFCLIQFESTVSNLLYSTGHQFSACALILGKNWVKKKKRTAQYGLWYLVGGRHSQ